jgi:hypothetical protein
MSRLLVLASSCLPWPAAYHLLSQKQDPPVLTGGRISSTMVACRPRRESKLWPASLRGGNAHYAACCTGPSIARIAKKVKRGSRSFWGWVHSRPAQPQGREFVTSSRCSGQALSGSEGSLLAERRFFASLRHTTPHCTAVRRTASRDRARAVLTPGPSLTGQGEGEGRHGGLPHTHQVKDDRREILWHDCR